MASPDIEKVKKIAEELVQKAFGAEGPKADASATPKKEKSASPKPKERMISRKLKEAAEKAESKWAKALADIPVDKSDPIIEEVVGRVVKEVEVQKSELGEKLGEQVEKEVALAFARDLGEKAKHKPEMAGYATDVALVTATVYKTIPEAASLIQTAADLTRVPQGESPTGAVKRLGVLVSEGSLDQADARSTVEAFAKETKVADLVEKFVVAQTQAELIAGMRKQTKELDDELEQITEAVVADDLPQIEAVAAKISSRVVNENIPEGSKVVGGAINIAVENVPQLQQAKKQKLMERFGIAGMTIQRDEIVEAEELAKIDVDGIGLKTDRGKLQAEQLNVRFSLDPDVLQEPQKVETIIQDMTKYYSSDKFLGDKTIPEADRQEILRDINKIVKRLRVQEMMKEHKYEDLPKSYEGELRRSATRTREARIVIAEINDDLQGKEPRARPANVGSLLNEFTSSLDPGYGGRLSAERLEQRLNQVQQQLRSSPDTEAQQVAATLEKLRGAIDTVRRQDAIYSSIDQLRRDRTLDPHLEQVGIRDKELQDIYNLVKSPKTFIEHLRKLSPADRDAEIKKFNINVRHLASKLLSVVDADHERFFDEIFTPLYHDPVYNNLVDGLNELQNTLKGLENKPEVEGGLRIKTEFEFFDRNKQFFSKKAERIDLSEAIGSLKKFVTAEKEFKRYFHNMYSLTLTRAPLESYVNYANHVPTEAIQLLLEENPELESAIRYHMQYLRVYQGFLENWKTPREHPYIPDPNDPAHEIPVDKFVKNQIRKFGIAGLEAAGLEHRHLEEWEIERLSAMARGFVLFANGEALDTLASGGPRGDNQFTQFWGPLHEFNPMRFHAFRWFANIFGQHELMHYAPNGEEFALGGRFNIFETFFDPHGMKPWDPKEIIVKADKLKALRKTKEPPRIVTEKMVREGIPLIEDERFFGTGLIKERGGWRHDMVKDLYMNLDGSIRPEFLNPDGSKNYEAILKTIMRVDLFVANRLLEDWYAEGQMTTNPTFRREQRNIYRKMILERLRNIAPQEFLILENALMQHKELKGYSREKVKDMMLGTSRITDYLLGNTVGDFTPTIIDLTDTHWQEIFTEKGIPEGMTQQQYIKEMKDFIEKLRVVASDAIDGRTGITLNDMDGKLEPWKEAVRIRSFPTYLEVKRNSNWHNLGPFAVGRAFGDANKISKTYWEVLPAIRSTLLDYQTNPDKAKHDRFQAYFGLVRKLYDAYDEVHGKSNNAVDRASVYKVGYQLSMMGLKYFQKSIWARTPGAGRVVSYLDPMSSWAHYSAGRGGVLELDEQMCRVWADTAEKLNLFAPSHGVVVDAKPRKLFGFIPAGNSLTYRRTNWNGARFRREGGATNIHVTVDILRSYIPLVIGLIVLAAITKSTEEEK